MYQIKVFCSITVPVFIFLRFRFFTTSAAFSMLQIIYRFLLTFWHCKKKDKIRMAMKDTKIAHTDMWYSFLLCALCRLSSIFSGFFIWTFSGGCAQVGAASIPCTFGWKFDVNQVNIFLPWIEKWNKDICNTFFVFFCLCYKILENQGVRSFLGKGSTH